MAKFVLKDAFVSINSVDLSDHVETVTLTHEAATPEKTAMSENSISRLPGLKNWTAEITFRHDFAASEVDITLFALVGAAAFPVQFQADATAAVSATNPKFTGNALLSSYGVLGGSIGDVAASAVTIMGDGDLTRGESA